MLVKFGLISAVLCLLFFNISASPQPFLEGGNDVALTQLEAKAIHRKASEAGSIEGRIEARGFGEGGWITPTGGSKDTNKVKERQVKEILAIEKFRQDEPRHRAVAKGNTAVVHDAFHSSYPGGPMHITVDFYNSKGKFITRLHIAPDGKRLVGDEGTSHSVGSKPPPNSPK